MELSNEALSLLDSIEEIETKSLSWGYVDGSLTELEVKELNSESHVLDELIDCNIIFEFKGLDNQYRYRSRFAELIRLLSYNRQLFPGRSWELSPSLVSDFRIDRRKRSFPQRNRSPNDILRSNEILTSSTNRQDLWSKLMEKLQIGGLARFQERSLCRLLEKKEDEGTIITAGTGSGKTLAFYLPAMIVTSEHLNQDNWVKVLSIYPRVELLKDQFTEAFKLARVVGLLSKKGGGRKILMGTFFGSTPFKADQRYFTDWKKNVAGYVCPWIRCPTCEGDMVWAFEDLKVRKEALRCSEVDCSEKINEDEIILTRDRIQRTPPDFLFTTTETLNRRLSDKWSQNLFGINIDSQKKPLFTLLDEVHTYEGSSGAHSALTFRRWRNLVGKPIHWVGLSATLSDADRFFSDLTGVDNEKVEEITPRIDEMHDEGSEYQIILRGQSSERTSLLSTTIQTAMLLPRFLEAKYSGTYGKRAFLFTDDLDVTNRLYYNLLDAEAYNIFARPDNTRKPLAALRGSQGDPIRRNIYGQRWKACEDIGHPLDKRLSVGRTTSQDSGVGSNTNIIVATASLEVGFNDPEVGAVIQHKAPRGMASFLQRKGRAGRTKTMRPITLTVLSDFGRDRSFYQSYETLFDPTIDSHYLPIKNPYILKIQAVYAFFDWLSVRVKGKEKGSIWGVLSAPLDNPHEIEKTFLDKIKKKLIQIIKGDKDTINDLKSHIIWSLSISEVQVDSLLWEPPRSLLLEAIPTLYRRVFKNWKLAFPTANFKLDLNNKFHPLPDYVPQSLFGDLGLPEIKIVIPPATTKHEQRIEQMPILQTINQFAPGRVSRRFAFERGALSHWSPLPELKSGTHQILVNDYAITNEYLGEFSPNVNQNNSIDLFQVYRPWTIKLSKVEKINREEILPSSNSIPNWHSNLSPNGEAFGVPVPKSNNWSGTFKNVEFFLHRFRSSVRVQRFAPSVEATTLSNRREYVSKIEFKDQNGDKSAIGYELDVDF